MFKDFFRRRSIRKAYKFKDTGLTPLSSIKTASVYLSSHISNWEECIAAVNDYFDKMKIRVRICVVLTEQKEKISVPEYRNTVYLDKEDLNWFGGVKNYVFEDKICSNADLAISLAPDCFPADFCVAATKTVFRIGTRQAADNLYDLVISCPQERQISQKESFEAIIGILTKIK